MKNKKINYWVSVITVLILILFIALKVGLITFHTEPNIDCTQVSMLSIVADNVNQCDNYGQAWALATKQKRPMIILLTANWCGPCQKLKQQIAPLLPKLRESYVVYYLDVNEEQQISQAYQKAKLWDGSVPTLYVTKWDKQQNQVMLGRTSGYMTQAEFIQWHNELYRKREK